MEERIEFLKNKKSEHLILINSLNNEITIKMELVAKEQEDLTLLENKIADSEWVLMKRFESNNFELSKAFADPTNKVAIAITTSDPLTMEHNTSNSYLCVLEKYFPADVIYVIKHEFDEFGYCKGICPCKKSSNPPVKVLRITPQIMAEFVRLGKVKYTIIPGEKGHLFVDMILDTGSSVSTYPDYYLTMPHRIQALFKSSESKTSLLPRKI